MATQSPAFKQAVIDSKKLTSKPTNDELLELYALFKIGTGEDYEAATKPGMFDLKGKAKYNAWGEMVDNGVTVEEAQKKYVTVIDQHKGTYGFDPNKTSA